MKQQHKKCAELLLKKNLNEYQRLSEWMNIPNIISNIPKAISDRFHWHLALAEQSLKEHRLLSNIRQKDRKEPKKELLPIAIYLDHIRSAYNVGSIIRTAEAFSLGTLYFSEQTPFIDHKQVQDTSMGCYEWIPCQREFALSRISHKILDEDGQSVTTDLPTMGREHCPSDKARPIGGEDGVTDCSDSPRVYEKCGLSDLPKPIIALETSDDAISIYDFSFPERFTLVLGNEEYGCSPELLQMAETIIEIPLCGRKNSLNVANAFAIAAAIIRQRI